MKRPAARSPRRARLTRRRAFATRPRPCGYGAASENRALEIDCAEIRIRAERRLGELLIVAKAAGQLKRGKAARMPRGTRRRG